MPSNESFAADLQQPKRLALFVGVFIAGMVGGAVFASSLTHAQQRSASIGSASAAFQIEVPVSMSDPSVPDAAAALKQRRNEPEVMPATF